MDKLYQLEIIEEDATNGKVKVHYTGYGSDDDEWRDKEDIVVVESSKPGKVLHVCLATILYYKGRNSLHLASAFLIIPGVAHASHNLDLERLFSS